MNSIIEDGDAHNLLADIREYNHRNHSALEQLFSTHPELVYNKNLQDLQVYVEQVEAAINEVFDEYETAKRKHYEEIHRKVVAFSEETTKLMNEVLMQEEEKK